MAIPISYSFHNLGARKFTAILTAGGMALVTFVFGAVLMLAQGLERTLVDTGSPDNAIVLRGSAETEVSSVIDRASADIIEVQPEVDYNAQGDAIAAKEALVLVTFPKRGTGKPTNVVVRGVGPHSKTLRPKIRLIAGRYFSPGSREVVAGKSIAERIAGTSLGETLNFALTDWHVVGIMDSNGTAFDSELWADSQQLMSAFRRTNYSTVILRTPAKNSFEAMKKRLEGDPRLTVQVKREIAFYKEQSEVMSKFIRILGLAMTIFFSAGAILGAMVTMYTAVASRTQEIGTLRALGFKKWDILAAFLAESLMLGFVGGGAGIVASSFLQWLTISTINWQSFSELAFGFELTPAIAVYAGGFALIMGLLGGLLPAWRAANLKIVDALRAT